MPEHVGSGVKLLESSLSLNPWSRVVMVLTSLGFLLNRYLLEPTTVCARWFLGTGNIVTNKIETDNKHKI